MASLRSQKVYERGGCIMAFLQFAHDMVLSSFSHASPLAAYPRRLPSDNLRNFTERNFPKQLESGGVVMKRKPRGAECV